LTVDLEHFPRLVDALHGLDLAVSDELDDPLDPEGMGLRSAKFRTGRQTLDGADALAFARSRRVGGERNRRRRHLQLLSATVDRVREVKSPAALLRMVTVARECTGASVSRRDWTALIANAPRLRRATIAADSLGPPIVSSVREPDRWVDTADPQQLAAAVGRFLFPQRDGCQPRERGARRSPPNVDAP